MSCASRLSVIFVCFVCAFHLLIVFCFIAKYVLGRRSSYSATVIKDFDFFFQFYFATS